MIYTTTDGTFIGFGLHALREHIYPNTIPQNPSASDYAHFGVVEVAEPSRPGDTFANTYELDITDGVASWVATRRPDADIASRMVEWRANTIKEVKAEANRRILDRMPDFKQRNYIAFNLEMERKERKGEVLTPTELATIAFTEGEWEFAKAIRSASNVIEAEIALLTDAEAGVFDVENHPLWVV
jgi:hypothetical protein